MVEANATVLGSVTMALGIAGLTVDAARNRAEALALTKRHRYGLVLANLRMPGLDGPTLYRELAHRWPENPPRIIFISDSLFSPDYAQFILEIGSPVLVKPIAPCALWNRVEEQLVSWCEALARTPGQREPWPQGKFSPELLGQRLWGVALTHEADNPLPELGWVRRPALRAVPSPGPKNAASPGSI